MYIWWIFLFLAYKAVADQSRSELANNGGKSKLWPTDRVDRIENVLLNLSNRIKITKLHGEIRNVQDKISVEENKTEEMIANWKQEMDPELREINVQTDDLDTNLTDMMEQEINATSNKINVQTDDLDPNLTDMVTQDSNATSDKINVQTDDLDTNLTDMVTQNINVTSDKINVQTDDLDTNLTDMVTQDSNATSDKINVQTDHLYTNLTDMVTQNINVTSDKINVQTDDLDTNLTDMMEQEINATSNKIHVQTDDLDTNLTDMMEQEINATSNKINVQTDDLDTNLTNRMKQNNDIAQHNIFPDHATIAKLTGVNDHVKIQVADPEAFHTSVVRQRQQAIQNRSYRSTIESWQPNSLQQLAETIKAFSKGKSLIDRHWIIFYWIAYNIKYDAVSYFSKDYKDQSAEGVFRTKKGVCAGYANIYKHLCDQLQTPCEVVPGFAKGYGFDNREGAPTEPDHAWNVVEIDRHWYLIESTWAAGYLNQEKTFEHKLNPYYFLPRPNEMIYDHLPKDKKWQLLRTPINMTQYMQMPTLYPTYFKLNVELVSPRDQAHIDLFPDSPYALVLMRVPSDVHLIADLKLNHQKIDGGDYIIFDNKNQVYCCYFAPIKIGMHKITIYAKQEQGDTESDAYSAVLDLTLDIKQMPSNPISFPKTWENFFDLGLEIISPQNTHIIRLNNGTTHTQIQIKAPDNVKLIGSLENEQGQEVIGGHNVYYDRQKNIWQCNFAPDQNGSFDAIIFAKRKSDPGNYPRTVSFKIDAKEMPINPISFPKTWENFFDLGLEVISPQNTHIIRLNNGTTHTRIQIKAPDNVQLIGSLKNDQGQNVIGGHNVYYDRQKNIWQCNFAPDQNGSFDAIISAKKKSDPGNYPHTVSFKIDAKQIPAVPLSYPYTWQLFHDLGLKIEAPKNRSNVIWPVNASYAEVLIQAPDDVKLSCSIVYNNVKIGNGSLAQYNHEKQYWQLLFAPERTGSHELIVFAKRIDGNESSSSAVVKFNLDVTKVQRPMKFPLIYSHFETKKCRIYTPIDGILKKDSVVPIHYVIPGAIDVDVVVDSKWLKSEGYKDPILQRQITVGSKEVAVYAKYGEKSNYNVLVIYTVQ